MLDHVDPEEAKPNLADLVRINSHFGGYSTAIKLVSSVASRDDHFTMLDIGAASGDTGCAIKRAFPNAKITSLDYNAVNAAAAPKPKLIADAFDLPVPPQSFDFVFSSLFLHHFTDEQVVDLLRSFYSTARKAVLIVDLERHIIPRLFLPATQPIFKWHRISVHDGIISVRAAFTRSELLRLAAQAGMKQVKVNGYRPAFRLTLAAAK